MALARCILKRLGERPNVTGPARIVASHAAGDVLSHGFERDSARVAAFVPAAHAISDHRQKGESLGLPHQGVGLSQAGPVNHHLLVE
jgi:hypothetical protein